MVGHRAGWSRGRDPQCESIANRCRHDQHWSNRLILGDSLLVRTSLAEKERLKGQVQMIYVDPPFGRDGKSNGNDVNSIG